jgi:hypothetical protein
MKRILIATDGSAAAQHAVELGARKARGSRDRIRTCGAAVRSRADERLRTRGPRPLRAEHSERPVLIGRAVPVEEPVAA